MRRMLTSLIVGLVVLTGGAVIAEAGCDPGDFFTEGPSYKRGVSQAQVVRAGVECVDHESFYTEGMRISPCERGPECAAVEPINARDFYREGFSLKELENMRHIHIINRIEPAAGK